MTDTTAAARQIKRLSRMQDKGITRSTVMVHDCCKPALEALRPHLIDPSSAEPLEQAVSLIQSLAKPINVSQVAQLSPFRYPGGKTWLVPEVRIWLKGISYHPSVFVEPFAGGAIVGLTIAAESLAESVILNELDDDVAAVWDVVINRADSDADWLCEQILTFQVNLPNVLAIINTCNSLSQKEKAFRTIVKNRTQRGGILAPGAGIVKVGESGKGLLSRWYPETLVRRIKAIRSIRGMIRFDQQDAFSVISHYSNDPHAVFFIDPPYTAGGKKAGSRLYTHSIVDHEALFAAMKNTKGQFIMTYDNADEVKKLAANNGFKVNYVPMKNTHHEIIYEILITKN